MYTRTEFKDVNLIPPVISDIVIMCLCLPRHFQLGWRRGGLRSACDDPWGLPAQTSVHSPDTPETSPDLTTHLKQDCNLNTHLRYNGNLLHTRGMARTYHIVS